jgi:hypothetical protein
MQNRSESASSLNIGVVKGAFYLAGYMRFYPYFLQFKSHLDKIR